MIVTLTPNPSLDRTIAVPVLLHGAVMRATESREDPGGKGLNVSRALAQNGTRTRAVLPIGGVYGGVMLDLLRAQEIDVVPVPIAGAIRANVAIVEPDGATTKVNEQGPCFSADEVEALRGATAAASAGAGWVVCCGSLPPGIDDGFYADLIGRCHEAGVKVAVDSSGEPMTRALAATPDLVKPNRVELAEAVGRELATMGAVIDAAKGLVATGIGCVLVSLGRDGALLVDDQRAVRAVARVDNPLSTVGAGDAFLAGYLHAVASGLEGEAALRTAVAFGAAAVSRPGSEMPTPAEVAAIDVTVETTPDRDAPLDD